MPFQPPKYRPDTKAINFNCLDCWEDGELSSSSFLIAILEPEQEEESPPTYKPVCNNHFVDTGLPILPVPIGV